MRETEFIHQNKEKWGRFERVLQNSEQNAEEMTRLFIETTDDLSYSRTNYPHRSVRIYLNSLAQKVFHKIYANRKRQAGAFSQFWIADLPNAMWHARKQLLTMFILFMAFFFLGMFSSSQSPEMMRALLGEQYIEMTEANIANGDPMAVYKSSSAITMFFEIGWNNIRVSFYCFVTGLFFGLGTYYIVGYNAMMVGAFIQFFVQRGLFRESFLAIMLHGTIELSMIVLAGTAGVVLGRGLIYPGTYTRMQALVISARRGMKIMLGVSAFLVIAAFIESFATRNTDIGDLTRLTLILISLGVTVFYFVLYPWYRSKNNLVGDEKDLDDVLHRSKPIELFVIKPVLSLATQGWEVGFSMIQKLGVVLLSAIGIATGTFFLHRLGIFERYAEYFPSDVDFMDLLSQLWSWDELHNTLQLAESPALFILYAVFLTAVTHRSIRLFRLRFQDQTGSIAGKHDLVNALLLASILLLPFLFENIAAFALALLIVPYFTLVWASASAEGSSFILALVNSPQWLKGTLFKSYALLLAQLVLMTFAIGIANAGFAFLLQEIVLSQFPPSAVAVEDVTVALSTFFVVLPALYSLTMLLFSFLLYYYSNKEITTAATLKKQIAQLKIKKRAFGLEKEI
ncbi:MAG: hypothetical protein RL226_416 [Bacteroidota bacterium]|jgi:uncharacterized membrane protein SpoIIM required for sporulation